MEILTNNFIEMFKGSFGVIFGEPEPEKIEIKSYLDSNKWDAWQVWSALAFLQAINNGPFGFRSNNPIKFPEHLNDAYTFFRLLNANSTSLNQAM